MPLTSSIFHELWFKLTTPKGKRCKESSTVPSSISFPVGELDFKPVVQCTTDDFVLIRRKVNLTVARAQKVIAKAAEDALFLP